MLRHLRTLFWTLEAESSTEYATLSQSDDGFELKATVLMIVQDRPTCIHYHIHVDLNWHTQSVEVRLLQGEIEKRLSLRVDHERRWWWGETEVVACRGCLDVDLSFSPSTNTLALRRLALAVEESKTITTAWVQIADFEVGPFPQRYTRLAANDYLFTSLNSDFQAKLRVDEFGLVTDYEGLWQSAGHI